jgi:hypothetical protein
MLRCAAHHGIVPLQCAAQEGEVLKQPMQSYESHIPFLLQFFLDHEVHGMGWLHLNEAHVLVRSELELEIIKALD